MALIWGPIEVCKKAFFVIDINLLFGWLILNSESPLMLIFSSLLGTVEYKKFQTDNIKILRGNESLY